MPETLDRSTLMGAASTGRIDVIRLCLRARIEINSKADDGFTALHCAARMNQVAALEFLLKCGADSSVYSDSGNLSLPIHEAILGKSLECFMILLQAKAQLKSHDGSFKNVIAGIIAIGDPRFVQCFIGSMDDVADVRSAVNSIALAAAGCGQLAVIRSLVLSHPEDVKVAANSRQSPLYLAAKRGYLPIIETLLNLCESRKVSNEALASVKISAMRAAAKRGHIDVLRRLLPSGERTPIEVMGVAVENEQQHVVRFLAEKEPHLDGEFDGALRQAIRQNHVDLVSYIASLGPCDTHGWDPALYVAIKHHSWASCEALLQSNNCNVNLRQGLAGPTALHIAVEAGSILAMKLLLQDEEIDVNAEWNCKVALDMAIAEGAAEAISLLLRQPELDVNRITIQMTAGELVGETALHRVIKKVSPENLMLLLQHPHIDVNVKSDKGKTPLDLALHTNVSKASDRSLQDKLGQLLIGHQSFDLTTWNDNAGGSLLGILEKFGYWSSFELLLDRENIKMPSSIWSSDPRAMQIILRHCGYIGCQATRLSLQRLLSEGVISVNARTPEGRTLLHYAAENNEVELMRDLLSHKQLNSDLKYLSYDFGYSEGRQTPTGIAKAWGHSGIVDLLRKHDCTIDAILN